MGVAQLRFYGTAGRPVIVLIASLNDGNHYYVEMAR